MKNKEFKELMLKNGAFLLHFGLIVRDTYKSIKYIDELPGVNGDWDIVEVVGTAETIIVGAPFVIRCSCVNLFDYTQIELVEPLEGKCEGSHFADFITKQGEGLHHIAYGFPQIEDFKKIVDRFVSEKYKIVHHARGPIFPGTTREFLCEYCYMQPPESGLYIELNWSSNFKDKK